MRELKAGEGHGVDIEGLGEDGGDGWEERDWKDKLKEFGEDGEGEVTDEGNDGGEAGCLSRHGSGRDA